MFFWCFHFNLLLDLRGIPAFGIKGIPLYYSGRKNISVGHFVKKLRLKDTDLEPEPEVSNPLCVGWPYNMSY